MPWRIIAFALGVWSLQQCAVLPPPSLFILAVASAALLLLAPPARRRPWLMLLAAALLGFAWAGARAQLRLADALPPALEGRDISVVGVVASLPQDFGRGVRFFFDVNGDVDGEVDGDAAASTPRRIALAWYDGGAKKTVDSCCAGEAASPSPSRPRAGERWRFTVRLKRPHGMLNPHGFDYEAWLFERGVRARGYVRRSPPPERLAAAHGLASIGAWREAARQRIGDHLAAAPYAGVLQALAVGDQQAISPQLWRLFAATGVTHLMSISGLHVTMIGLLIAWLTQALWRRAPRLPLLWPAQKAAALAGLIGAAAYALFAGFGVPAQRTLYMLAVAVIALLGARAVTAPQVLGAALLLVLLLDPWAVMAPGFWLSFGAVALLIHIAIGRLGRRNWLLEWGRAQWAVSIGLAPMLLALFQQFSFISPLANALAIPLMSLAITPLALLGLLPGCAWALDIAHTLLQWLLQFLDWLAATPFALWRQHAPPPWTLPLALAGVAWLLTPRGLPARWLGLVMMAPLFFVYPPRPSPGGFKLVLLDVGQGLATHVQTARHDLLFDSGPGWGGGDAGARTIAPYLYAAGVRRLDALVVSHADKDHAGGAASLIAAMPTQRLWASLPPRHQLWRRVAAAHPCRAGVSWTLDGVLFEFLHPASAAVGEDNADSCVLRISGKWSSALLPGDLDGAGEAAFTARYAGGAAAEVLLAPHHGSKNTSSAAFVAAVGARHVIFSAGYRNRFGHPHAEVVQRYVDSGAVIHRSDVDGAVSVHSGANGLRIEHERQRRQRYWREG